MRYLVVIAAVALFMNLTGQSVLGQSTDVQISIDSVTVSENGRSITAVFICKSLSDKNLLLYGFEGELNRFTDLARMCNLDRVSARFALFVYDENGVIQYPEWSIPDSIDYQPMPKERLAYFMEEERSQYRRATRMIKANQSFVAERKIDLADFHLQSGKYFLQVGYYSGKGINQLLHEAEVAGDMRIHHATVFRGCILSNKSSFYIK